MEFSQNHSLILPTSRIKTELLLSKSGIPLVSQTSYQQWEESLWRGLVQQPNVAISYRRTDEDGTQLDPSHLLPNSPESVLIEIDHSRDRLTDTTSLLLQAAQEPAPELGESLR